MTRDGLIEVNETQQTAERISSREADSDFSQPDSAAAERVIEHLDAAHTRKANKKEVKKSRKLLLCVLPLPLPACSLPRKNGQRRNWNATLKNQKKPLTDWTQQRQLSQSKRNWLRSAPLTKPQERQRPAFTLRNRKSRYPAAKAQATRYPAPRRKRVFLFTTKSIPFEKDNSGAEGRTNRRNLPSAAQSTGQGNSNRATAAIS